MGKEFYSDAIKLMKSFARGNQSSRKILGDDGRSSKGRMQQTRSRAPSRPAPSRPGGRGGKP